jgi:hypothetical protein
MHRSPLIPASARRHGVVVAFIASAVGLAVTGCKPKTDHDDQRSTPVAGISYFQHVKQLIDDRCVGCHAEGEVAFPLTSYDAVASKQSAVVAAVTSRRMPVWLAAPGHQTYHDDPTFTDDELALVAAWRDGGYQRGDESKPSQVEPGGIALRDLDADLSLPVLPEGTSYLPDQEHPDDYRCFIVDWPIRDQEKFLTGLQVIPGNRGVVHHLVAYSVQPSMVPMLRQLDGEEDGPGYRCFGGAVPDRLGDAAVRARIERQFPGSTHDVDSRILWLGHWAPGMRATEMPDGLGLPIPAGGAVVVQMHYYSRNAPNSPDQGTEVRFRLADSIKRHGFVMPLSDDRWIDANVNRSLVVPAGGELTVRHGASLALIAKIGSERLGIDKPVKRVIVHSANLHMHSYGKSATAYLTDARNAKDVLLEIPRWDLRWQRDYDLVEPKALEGDELATTKLNVECTYANATDHEVIGGLGSDQEMCFDFSLLELDYGD